MGGFLEDFDHCFKLGCSGPSLLTCRRILLPFIYALPADFQEWPWPAAAGCEQEVWVASPVSLAEAEEEPL